ncbi:hypothetical protein Mapa_011725 [Marchantia paleacea]|nr:hypothetical protein Mapa_011725 [Marchantia paleacea]
MKGLLRDCASGETTETLKTPKCQTIHSRYRHNVKTQIVQLQLNQRESCRKYRASLEGIIYF